MSESDPELESLRAKRMVEMRNNVSKSVDDKPEEKKPSKSARDILVGRLGHRGLEVLENAESQRPHETRIVVGKLGELIQNGELQDVINGGDLLSLFGSLGIRVRMRTKISVESDGKLVSLADKLGSVSSEPDDEA